MFRYLLAALMVGLVAQAHAECPAASNVGANIDTTNFGRITISSQGNVLPSMAPPDGLFVFVGGGCTAMAFGPNPPNQCFDNMGSSITSMTFNARLDVRWTMGSFNNTMNGCTFTCPGGTCRVRGADGLPVELLNFGVDEPADGDSLEE